MTTGAPIEWGADCLEFRTHLMAVFHHREPQAQAAGYLGGLKASESHKDSWQVVEERGYSSWMTVYVCKKSGQPP